MISAVPAFQDNYIWIIENPTTRSATVVDPGDAGPVLDYLKSKDADRYTALIAKLGLRK